MLSPLDVSRETIEKLKLYEGLLRKWQPHLNLISNSTLDSIWDRHFLDSAQLYNLISNKHKKICDLGSGAGFPGAVLAIMGCDNVTLIERDKKKCSFLRNVSRETKVKFNVFEGDVKDYPNKADIITSRALASLTDLIKLSKPLLKPETTCLFLKGESVDDELKDLSSNIKLSLLRKNSITAKESIVLQLDNITFD